MIVTDGVHIAGDTVTELHAFAEKAGIKRCWFHRNPRHPHYDKPKRYSVDQLLAHGAVATDSRTVLAAAQRAALTYAKPKRAVPKPVSSAEVRVGRTG